MVRLRGRRRRQPHHRGGARLNARRGGRHTHLAGFDDGPFTRHGQRRVLVVGVVYAGTRLDGVLSGTVTRDGVDSTRTLIRLITGSRFHAQLHAVLLKGIAFAGFNVVDVPRLATATGLPVLVVARRAPRLEAIRRALLGRVPGGARKWRLIETLGPMEPLAGLYVQRHGLDTGEARALIEGSRQHGALPEPLRVAHLVAGGIARGESRGRA